MFPYINPFWLFLLWKDEFQEGGSGEMGSFNICFLGAGLSPGEEGCRALLSLMPSDAACSACILPLHPRQPHCSPACLAAALLPAPNLHSLQKSSL